MSIDLKDLSKVIKACKAAGVAKLKVGDIELEFHKGDTVEPTKTDIEPVLIPSADELKAAIDRVNIQENVEAADDALAFMHIEDPAHFEKLLVEREFEDSGKTHN